MERKIDTMRNERHNATRGNSATGFYYRENRVLEKSLTENRERFRSLFVVSRFDGFYNEISRGS